MKATFKKGQRVSFRVGRGRGFGKIHGYNHSVGKWEITTDAGATVLREESNISKADSKVTHLKRKKKATAPEEEEETNKQQVEVVA